MITDGPDSVTTAVLAAALGGKAVLVAGGSGGIGAATARLFAEAGAAVTITHRPGKEAEGALCQEDARASCCTRDEGGPFGAVL